MHEKAVVGSRKSVAGAAFEPSEPNMRFIALIAAGIVVSLVAVVLWVRWYWDRVHTEQVFVKQLEPVSEDFKALRAREEAVLHSYRWVDREKGTVRIPIERAMELVVKERADAK